MELILSQIQKSFDDKEVLKDITYEFVPGKIYGLLGRNGAGKTTLFRIIYADLEKDGGEILLKEGENTHPLSGEEVGMVFSQPILPNFLTGYEFIRFYMDIHEEDERLSPEDYFRRYQFLEKDMHRLIIGYSHGMKSKLNLMCMEIAKPKVILLDEPLTSLDVVVASEMKKMLLDLKKDSILIVSTHILQLAKDLCDEIVLLRHGTLTGLKDLSKDDPDYEEEIIRQLKEDEQQAQRKETEEDSHV